MRYILILLIAVTSFHCSHKMAPDAAWGSQRWVLVEMKGVPVQQSGGRRDAYINFEVDQHRFRGNGGCNQVNGTYTIDKSEIHFLDISSTKMNCEDIAFENTFLSTLETVDRYEVRTNELLLKKRKETVLVLRAR